jgi:hypothetical protein
MGKAVESAYLRKAYNRAFPDPADPLRMYEAIIESQALPPQTRETLEAIWMHYRASYNKINQAMCKAQDEWAESVTFLGGFDKEPEYEEKFKAWTRQRVKLTRDLWSTMKPLLSKEVLNEKTSLVGEWEAQLQRTEKFVARLPDLRYWVYE